MPRDFFGEILSLGLESFVPLSRTMVFNLIAKLLGGIVVTLALQIGILPRLIHKGMDKSRLSTRS